jgi:hypothetical protein
MAPMKNDCFGRRFSFSSEAKVMKAAARMLL